MLNFKGNYSGLKANLPNQLGGKDRCEKYIESVIEESIRAEEFQAKKINKENAVFFLSQLSYYLRNAV
jgi:hypothetical protein